MRSEDAATGETEGEHAEPWPICQVARAILGEPGPHVDCDIQTQELPNKKGIPRIAPG